MPVTRPDGPSARDLDTSDRAGSACEARAGAMSLSDDFAKVQLQAAAATKDLSQQPRLGAVPRRGGTRFCSFLASSARTKGRALPGDASTDPFLSNIPRRVPNGDGRERSSGHPGQGQGETAAELRARSPAPPPSPRGVSHPTNLGCLRSSLPPCARSPLRSFYPPRFLANPQSAQYAEIVNIQLGDGSHRRGQVLEVDGERAVVQVFEGTSAWTVATLSSSSPVRCSRRRVRGHARAHLQRLRRSHRRWTPVMAEEYLDIQGSSINPSERTYPEEMIRLGSAPSMS